MTVYLLHYKEPIPRGVSPSGKAHRLCPICDPGALERMKDIRH